METTATSFATPSIVSNLSTQNSAGVGGDPWQADTPPGSCEEQLPSDEPDEREALLADPTTAVPLPNASNAVGNQYPTSDAEAISRVLLVQQLYETGVLGDEVSRIGVDPQWLDSVFKQPRGVLFSEHLLYLPTLFGKLGRFGGPAALARALGDQARLARLLSMVCGPPVYRGFLTSYDFSVASHGITSGFYVTLPEQTGKPDLRKRFLSCDELKRLSNSGFRDLWLSGTKLKDILNHVDQLKRRLRKGHGLGGHLCESTLAYRLSVEAIDNFVADLEAATVALGGTTRGFDSVCLNYCALVAELNQRLVARFGYPEPFSVFESEASNLLPTFGIRDWRTFLRSMLDTKLVAIGEPVLRYREISGSGHPYYRNLRLSELSKASISFEDTASRELFELDSLVERSRNAVREGRGPTLLPAAPIRYWSVRGVGNSLLLDDGMSYAKLDRLARALCDPRFVLAKRAPLVYPYSRLTEFTPANQENPYDALGGGAHCLAYHEFARRLQLQNVKATPVIRPATAPSRYAAAG